MEKLSRTQSKGNSDAKILWVAKNRGIFTRIGDEHGMTQPFVSDVFWGRRRSKGQVIEAALAAVSAPGFERYRRSK